MRTLIRSIPAAALALVLGTAHLAAQAPGTATSSGTSAARAASRSSRRPPRAAPHSGVRRPDADRGQAYGASALGR